MTAAAAPAHKAPKTLAQATALLDRVARIDGETATFEDHRNAAIAATNAAADALVLPLIVERAAIVALLEPWWTSAAAMLTGGKRKSVTLGGCDIGTKAKRAKLAYSFADDAAAVAALKPLRWAKPLLKVTTTLDRVALMKALVGTQAAALKALGFSKEQGETFFVERVVQHGTVTDAAG